MGNLYLRLQAITMLAQSLNVSLKEAEEYLDKMDKCKIKSINRMKKVRRRLI